MVPFRWTNLLVWMRLWSSAESEHARVVCVFVNWSKVMLVAMTSRMKKLEWFEGSKLCNLWMKCCCVKETRKTCSLFFTSRGKAWLTTGLGTLAKFQVRQHFKPAWEWWNSLWSGSSMAGRADSCQDTLSWLFLQSTWRIGICLKRRISLLNTLSFEGLQWKSILFASFINNRHQGCHTKSCTNHIGVGTHSGETCSQGNLI